MGGTTTKFQHEYINHPASVVEESSTGFHLIELHMETVKFSIIGLLVLVAIVVAAFYFWRRCRRNVQRRQWRRVLDRQSSMPSGVLPFGGVAPVVRYQDPAVSTVPPSGNRALLFHEAYPAGGPTARVYPLLGSGRGTPAPPPDIADAMEMAEVPPLPKNL